jgi:hypothetical protein
MFKMSEAEIGKTSRVADQLILSGFVWFLINQGLTKAQIYAVASELNDKFFEPPLETPEVRRIVRGMIKNAKRNSKNPSPEIKRS